MPDSGNEENISRFLTKGLPALNKRPVDLKSVDNWVLLLVEKSNNFAIHLKIYINSVPTWKRAESVFITKTNRLV